MKVQRSNRPLGALPDTMKMTGGIVVAALTFLAAVPAMAETTVSGQSDTILRLGHSELEGSKNLFPVYEYLRASVVSGQKDGSSVSFSFGGWGRADLGDKSFNDKYVDGDLQYGFLSYRGGKNNFVANAGRQFVTEGVATERIDGLYLRSDLAAGFAAAAFVGSPVVTEPNFKADDFIYGGRVTQSNYKYYTVGLSALQSYSDGNRYREEEGVDLWLHPAKQVDVTGRSSYNSVTNGWMEHAYTATYTPLNDLTVSADLSSINYRDYFYRVTTSALSFSNRLIDPNEKVLALGGKIAYSPTKTVTVIGDYRNYNYDIAKSADYYGGSVNCALPWGVASGISIHRMDGQVDRLRYNEYRAFAAKKLGHFDLAADLIDVSYDSRTNGVKDAFTAAAAVGYEFSERLKLGADIDYSHNPDFDNEVKGLIKLTYLFDTTLGAEGRTKSEKH